MEYKEDAQRFADRYPAYLESIRIVESARREFRNYWFFLVKNNQDLEKFLDFAKITEETLVEKLLEQGTFQTTITGPNSLIEPLPEKKITTLMFKVLFSQSEQDLEHLDITKSVITLSIWFLPHPCNK